MSVSLTLKNISRRYVKDNEEFMAVNNVNLEVKPGEFLTFLGPSGCGKTTTLRMIAGFETPTSGQILMDGVDITHVPANERGLGFVFQNYALCPHMKIFDNVAYGLKIRGETGEAAAKKVREALAMVGLTKEEKRYPNQLSGGQQQRVALARVLVLRPKLLLMDEPLSNLDAKLRGQMRIEISKIHQRLGATIIYVTHDQTEAMTLGTRIVVMKDGVVQQVDTPQNLYQKPGNLFVAGFMGSPQMNFLDAVISEKGGNLIAKVGDHELAIPAAKAKALKDGGYVGKTVVLGIRPEDIHDSQMFIEAAPSAPMTSVVKVYELLGAEVFLYFDVNGTQVTARVDPRTTAKTGDPIKFAFDMEKSHFFDKETELTICN